MSNPGAYEQYPRPSEPAGPSAWQQPAFDEKPGAQRPEPFPVERPISALTAFRLDLLPSRASSKRSMRFWGRAALAGVVLAGVLVLLGATTQLPIFFGLAIASGMGALWGLVQAVSSFIELSSRPAGSSEHNG